MESTIPEVNARNILLEYDGANNHILELKQKYTTAKSPSLTRAQADYILKNYILTPKVARKYIEIVESHGKHIMEDRFLNELPRKIWCEKLLAQTDKAYHIWGRILDTDKFYSFWLPKNAVIPEEKKLNRVIDYSPYNNRPPYEFQKPAIEKLLANDKFILADDMGVGKGLVLSTLAYTPYGKVEIGTLKIGDKIIGSDGKSHNVIGVFPQGIKKTYKITFNDGVSIVCDESHLWKVSSCNFGENTNNGRIDKEIVLSTKQLLDKNLELEINGVGYNKNRKYKFKTYYKVKNGNSKWQIPIVKPIIFENNAALPIDPYLFGVCLGDGCFKKHTVNLCGHKDDFHEITSTFDILKEYEYRNIISTTINFGDVLIGFGLDNKKSYNKFIPDVYKYSSIENRLAILQGLMDTDGYCIKSDGSFFCGTQYTSTSEQLCDDVAEIVHSLGGIARKHSSVGSYKKNGIKIVCRMVYSLNIKLSENMNPFRLKRKREIYNKPKKYKIGRYIKNIEYAGKEETVCIAVNSPDKLYVIDHAIVTHNTTSAIIATLESDVKKVLIVCPATLKINWKREIEFYTDRRVLIVEGTKWGSTFDFYIINYDILKNYHSVEDDEFDNLLVNANFDLAIVDEAHNLANTTAMRTRIMNDVLAKIPKVWLLTGTPITSRPINYFNLLKLVDSPVTLNWQHYVKRYCKGFQFRVNNRKVWSTKGASNLDELREKTKSKIFRRLKSEILDLPEKIITPVFLEMENTQFYDQELLEFIQITETQKEKDSIAISLNRLMKVRQAIAYEKVPYTCDLINKFLEQDKKVIVFTNFTASLEMLHEKYPKNSVILDGRMSKEQRQRSIDSFQNDPKIKIFIGNIIAAGVGINLTAAESVIMNDLSFVPAHHSQAEDRSYRIGTKNSVLVYYPIFENTIEKNVYNMLDTKKRVIKTVMGDEIDEVAEETETAKDLIKSLLNKKTI